MIKTLATTLLLAGLALPAASAGPEEQPEMQSKNMEVLLGAAAQGRSYLGVDIRDITADRVGPLKLKEERGVEVTMVDQDAPAGKAGLKEHDVILDFNGARIESEEQLRRMIKETPPGRTVTLNVSRDGNIMKISAQLADRSKVVAESHPSWPVVPRIPEMPNAFGVPNVIVMQSYSRILGIQTEGLTRQLGEYFGVKNGEGILVRSVEKGSAAEKAGIKAGDVIVKAENEKLTDRSDLSRILRSHREAGKINLGIVRDKHEQTVTVEVPQHGAKDSSKLYLDFDDMELLEGNIDSIIEDSVADPDEPSESHNLVFPGRELRAQLRSALAAVRSQQPEMRRAFRDARNELRRTEKLMQQELKIEIKRYVDALI
ncbi:MAG: PDZ domain-containing protein [Acidobacteriia bacterium]|nr:PDZ domain-containing protein [Terriglobia bacterium]